MPKAKSDKSTESAQSKSKASDNKRSEAQSGLIVTSRIVKSAAQITWLKNRLPDFYSHQNRNKLADFWPKVKKDYLTAFPIEGQDAEDLDPEQAHGVAVLVKKHQDSVYYWFNNTSNTQRRCKGNAPSFNMTVDLVSGETVTSESSPADDSNKAKTKRKRVHKIQELFILEYYDTFREECNAKIATLAAHAEDGKVSRSARLKLVRRIADEKWLSASPEVRKRVEELQAAERTSDGPGIADDTDKTDNADQPDVDKSDSTDKPDVAGKSDQSSDDDRLDTFLEGKDLDAFFMALPGILGQFAANIGRKIPIALSILGAARDPKTQKMRSFGCHHGKSLTGLEFDEACPTFSEAILNPFLAFARRAIPKVKKGVSTTPSEPPSSPAAAPALVAPSASPLAGPVPVEPQTPTSAGPAPVELPAPPSAAPVPSLSPTPDELIDPALRGLSVSPPATPSPPPQPTPSPQRTMPLPPQPTPSPSSEDTIVPLLTPEQWEAHLDHMVGIVEPAADEPKKSKRKRTMKKITVVDEGNPIGKENIPPVDLAPLTEGRPSRERAPKVRSAPETIDERNRRLKIGEYQQTVVENGEDYPPAKRPRLN